MTALQLFSEPLALDEVLRVAIGIVGAALGGMLVALLYRISRSPDARRVGFAHTLVLLAPLIAMVTVAVGTNIAAAFTLVGTLAIVRFRTVVRDTRDMAFVIFSVAVGMGLGASQFVVAIVGLLVIGTVILFLRRIELSGQGRDAAVLRLVISPPDSDPSNWSAVVANYTRGSTVVKSSVDRGAATLDLRIAVHGVDADSSPAFLIELLQIPEVLRASFSPDEPE